MPNCKDGHLLADRWHEIVGSDFTGHRQIVSTAKLYLQIGARQGTQQHRIHP